MHLGFRDCFHRNCEYKKENYGISTETNFIFSNFKFIYSETSKRLKLFEIVWIYTNLFIKESYDNMNTKL
jgi:hypothetical protein